MAAPRQVALFLTAMQFLTRLPVPAARDFQPRWLGESLRYFPLVGGLVGLVNVAIWWLASLWFPPTVAVGLMLAASLLVTGAFHEYGFADTCDGLGGGSTRERALAIMKDSRIGAYGAIGLIMLLGLKWSALVALPVAAFALIVVKRNRSAAQRPDGLKVAQEQNEERVGLGKYQAEDEERIERAPMVGRIAKELHRPRNTPISVPEGTEHRHDHQREGNEIGIRTPRYRQCHQQG